LTTLGGACVNLILIDGLSVGVFSRSTQHPTCRRRTPFDRRSRCRRGRKGHTASELTDVRPAFVPSVCLASDTRVHLKFTKDLLALAQTHRGSSTPIIILVIYYDFYCSEHDYRPRGRKNNPIATSGAKKPPKKSSKKSKDSSKGPSGEKNKPEEPKPGKPMQGKPS
jgi:hypothetical protein